MKRGSRWLLGLGLVGWGAMQVLGYPLDGADRLGIRRLEGYRTDQAREGGTKLPPGALLSSEQIRLHLEAYPNLEVRGKFDPGLQKSLETLVAKRHPSYSVAVVDYTDPDHLAVAAIRGDQETVPGSVGKLGILVAFFDGLKRAFPDLEKRRRLLQDHVVEATAWAVGDRHTIPKFQTKTRRNSHGLLLRGERYTLAEWLDHMASVSSNAAASTVWKEAMLLRHFGSAYPPPPKEEASYFANTSKLDLQKASLAVIEEPLAAAGIRPGGFRQGTMFTRHGKAVVPGTRSYMTPLGVSEMLLRMEQGRLVDAWSSLEMKRFLYVTKRRVRYIFAPELKDAAVYFKSGSMYGCKPEPGFTCKQFEGNRLNLMNSAVLVESPAQAIHGQRRYLVVLTSNVLKVNAAWEHSRLGAAIEEAIRDHQLAPLDIEGEN